MKRPENFICLFVFFILTLLPLVQAYAQISKCDTISIFLKNKKLKEGRKVISTTLQYKPAQSDCFYKTSLEIYDSSIAVYPSNTLLQDSLFNILKLWYITGNECTVLNEEAKRYYLHKKEEKDYKENVCPYLRTVFLNCTTTLFYPESILSLSDCFLSNSYDRAQSKYSCKLEKKVWRYMLDNEQLLSKPEWQIIKNRVRNALLSCPYITCDELDSLFSNEIESLPLKNFKQLNSILSQKNCSSTKLYASTSAKILAAEPTFNGMYQFALVNKKIGSINESYSYYSKAEKLAETHKQKALCYLGIAELLEIQQKSEKAKEFALIAINFDPENRESFVFLANLYAKAESICALSTTIEKAALYLLISKNYKSGGLNAESEKYFMLSDIDNLIKKGIITQGQKIKIECFIKEEIQLSK